jgi:hypothetical protein
VVVVTLSKKAPHIEAALQEVITDEVAGDSMNEGKWVRQSLSYLAKALSQRCYRIGPYDSTAFAEKTQLWSL